MNYTLGLCKPKGASKYIGASYSWLWELATSSTSPLKAKRWPLGGCMLTVHVQAVACSTVFEDGHVEVVWGAPFGGIPLRISVWL